MSMQLYLIRHAESENNARPEPLREEDPPISELGRRQAEHLARWAKSLEIDFLITSPFLRTLQTTRMITDSASRPVQVWHNVFEQGGCYRGHGPDARQGAPGLGRKAIQQHLCEDESMCTVDATIGEEGWWFGKERETDEQARVRAAQIAQRITESLVGSGSTVVAVIHADIKRLILAELLGPHIDPRHLGPLHNTGITRLSHNGEIWTLDWFNSVSHLPAPLIGQGEGYSGR